MKLHHSVVERIISLVESYGGSMNQERLRKKIAELDLTPYEQKLNNSGRIILVSTEDYENQLKNVKTVK